VLMLCMYIPIYDRPYALGFLLGSLDNIFSNVGDSFNETHR